LLLVSNPQACLGHAIACMHSSGPGPVASMLRGGLLPTAVRLHRVPVWKLLSRGQKCTPQVSTGAVPTPQAAGHLPDVHAQHVLSRYIYLVFMLDGLEIFFDLITFANCLIMFLEQGTGPSRLFPVPTAQSRLKGLQCAPKHVTTRPTCTTHSWAAAPSERSHLATSKPTTRSPRHSIRHRSAPASL
jgi:hypothetical protein